jgi:transcriptional regulator with XRE-family HTH domain
MPKYKGQLEQSVELAIFQTRMATVLNAMRKRDRFKLRDLARRVGVSNTYMTKIMRGQANISLSLLFSFCRELDVPVTDLIGTWADNSVEIPEAMVDGHPHHDDTEDHAARY